MACGVGQKYAETKKLHKILWETPSDARPEIFEFSQPALSDAGWQDHKRCSFPTHLHTLKNMTCSTNKLKNKSHELAFSLNIWGAKNQSKTFSDLKKPPKLKKQEKISRLPCLLDQQCNGLLRARLVATGEKNPVDEQVDRIKTKGEYFIRVRFISAPCLL